jgi:iron complex outermembrane receptor protein
MTVSLFPLTALEDKGLAVRGKVTDREGEPMVGAGISVRGTFMGVLSGSDGHFVIENMKEGSYLLDVSFIGYRQVTFEVKLPGEGFVDIVMDRDQIIPGEVIVSATRAEGKVPVTYSNLSSDVISRMNAGPDLPYLLSLTPSLVETSESGNGIGYTSMRIRGTDASRINVTIDGIPLNDPESQQVFWVDLPDLASSVDNIQVQRGAGTSSNGSGAFGASVNIQTRGIEQEPFAEISSTAGSYSTFKNTISAGTGLLKDKFAFQMRFSDLHSDGYIDRTGSDHRSAFMSGIYRSARSVIKANIMLGEEHTGIGWWGVPAEVLGQDRRYNPAGEYTDINGITRHYDNESDNYVQSHYQLFYTLQPAKNLIVNSAFHYTRGKGYYEEYKEDRSFEEYGLPVIDHDGAAIAESDLIRRKWMDNDFYGLVWSVRSTGTRLQLTVGGGLNLFDGDHYGTIIWMQYPGSISKDHQWYLNNGTKGEVNIYSKASYSVTDRLSLYGDLQYRYIDYDMSGLDDDLKDLTGRHRFGFINPKAGVFYNITSGQDAYFSVSVANREPTRTDFKEAAGDPEATPESETLYDFEAGYSLKGSSALLSANLFAMLYDNQLVPTGELSNVGYPIQTNVRKSYRTGIELIAGLLFSEKAGWDANLTLSRNRIPGFTEYYTDYNTTDWSESYRNRDLGTVDIAYSPSVIAGSDLWFKMWDVVSLHLISKYVGKQYFDNTMNSERKLDPYFLNNIRIDVSKLTGKIRDSELQIFVNNIFNTKYESNAYGGNWFEDGVEKTWAYYFPQAGTNFMVRLNLRF